MAFPFIDLKQQYARLKPQIDANIQKVLDHGGYIMGPEVAQLEEALAEFTGARHCVSVSSGTDALLIALMSQGIGPGDAVFVPSFTFTATAEAIVFVGADPVFVDVDERTYNIDATSLEEAIETVRRAGRLKPRALIAVDLFGLPADYAKLNAIASRHDLFLLADAAQSLGARSGNKSVGSITHVTATSFFPAKPLGCYGDGGAVFTDDGGLAATMRSIRVHGQGEAKYEIVRVGLNGRLDTLQAAILLAKLSIFPDELAARHRVAHRYSERLSGAVVTPVVAAGSTSAWAQYTIQSNRREQLRAHLQSVGVPTAVYYPRPMHLQAAYRRFGAGEGSLPVSERLCDRVLSLPMHPYLTIAEIDQICGAVLEANRRAAA